MERTSSPVRPLALACAHDHEEEPGGRRHVRGERRQEASSCRLLLPRWSKLPLHRAVGGFSCGGCKVRHGYGPEERERSRSRSRERGYLEMSHGCTRVQLGTRRWPGGGEGYVRMVQCNRVQRWTPLSGKRRAHRSGTKLNPDELTWQFRARVAGRN